MHATESDQHGKANTDDGTFVLNIPACMEQGDISVGRAGDPEMLEDQPPPPTPAYLGCDPDPGWEPINWDEALNLTVSAMRRIADRHGPASVAFTVSSPSTTAIGDSTGFIQRLANAFGTRE